MRYRLIAFMVLALVSLTVGGFAVAQETSKPDVKGLFLLTDYPAISVRPGTTATIGLRLQNYAMPPERLQISVSGVPQGWTSTVVGGGQPIEAVLPATNASVNFELRLDIPKDAAMGTTNLTVTAKGANTVSLPVAVTLVKDLPAKLTLTPALPELRGNSRSTFEYQLTIKNESGKRIVASLAATAPPNFEVSFTEQYGSQELNAVPLDAGQSKDVKLKVRPPNTIGVGTHKVTARATAEDATVTAELGLEITGTPKIELSGREGRLNASAVAGQESTLAVIVSNTGTAAAEAVEMSGNGPSGWKVEADPKVVDRIPPNETREVQYKITPTAKAVAGDYVVTIRASARGESASQTFRVAVATSTQWGLVGMGIIGVALLVLFGAVMRYGRR
ncbi:MAG: hypothetical protein IT536_21705 [Hyphomicrobiales bacterium]|nr:hypothetical protein [Hyphomicrobiales bacterium]